VVIMQARSHSFLYVEADIPAGLTLDDWRKRTTRPSRRRLLRKR
jgi:hypothetical protein